jgi:phage tail-like protein
MVLPDQDSGVGHSFGLEFDGVQIKGITHVGGLKMEMDVIETKETTPDGTYVTRTLPGRWKASEITIERGLSQGGGFAKLMKNWQFGEIEGVRKDGAIIVYDYEGAVVQRYKLTNAWPKSLEIGALEAGATSGLVERLVIVCERLELE